MDSASLAYNRDTQGARWLSGGSIVSQAGALVPEFNGNLDDHSEVTIANTSFRVGDRSFTSIDTSSGGIPVYYRSGATEWRLSAATTAPVKFGTATIQYNSGSYALTDITNGFYAAYWVFASPDLTNPFVSIMGQSQHATLSSAQSGSLFEDLDTTGLPVKDMKLIARLIYRANSGYANTLKCVLAHVTDYSQAIDSTLSSSYMPSDHGMLSGNGDDDHLQYLLLAGRAGGQIAYGSTVAGENLFLRSTSNATKGRIYFGANSSFHETNNWLGIGAANPNSPLHVNWRTPTLPGSDEAFAIFGINGVDGIILHVEGDSLGGFTDFSWRTYGGSNFRLGPELAPDAIVMENVDGYVGLGINLVASITSRLTLATGTTAADGILFGTGLSNLYRSAADTLKTDGNFIVAGNLSMDGAQFSKWGNTHSANYTVLADDYTVPVDTTASIVDLEITIPLGDAASKGRIIVVKDIGGDCGSINKRCLLRPSGSDTIDGDTFGYYIENDYGSLSIQSDGANGWWIV
jgi:hypothetical protein